MKPRKAFELHNDLSWLLNEIYVDLISIPEIDGKAYGPSDLYEALVAYLALQ